MDVKDKDDNTASVSAVQAVKNPVEDGRDHLAPMCVHIIKPQLYASYLSCNIELASFFSILYLVYGTLMLVYESFPNPWNCVKGRLLCILALTTFLWDLLETCILKSNYVNKTSLNWGAL